VRLVRSLSMFVIEFHSVSASASESAHLHLLLADAHDARPVLADGLPEQALGAVPSPERAPRGKDSLELDAPDRDPNDLAAQRWGVIAVQGEDGDRPLAAIRALIEHRRAQQGPEPVIFRVPPDMDTTTALRWKNEVLRGESLSEDIRPRYLLILGDLDRVSVELQHVLAHGSYVGRLHCPTLAGYRAYAEKVVARERDEVAGAPRALYYTVQDGTGAVVTGHQQLVAPCIRMTREWSETGRLDLDALHEIPFSDWGPDDMLTEAGVAQPSVMLSLSHGLGAPRQGWRSPEQQRALQGALSMGDAGPLTADTVRESPFLPGGVWLPVACFAAGTPKASAFHSWLALLAERGGDLRRAQEVLRSLPGEGERPFLAALPQALLANPLGPLAVIGHIDLAWTFGFVEATTLRSRASRIFSTLRALLAGSRVGVALDALMHVYRETNNDLLARYQLQRDAHARGQPDPVASRTFGNLWIQRNDLRGYVLLGDPATRLAVRALRVPREMLDAPAQPTPAITVVTAAPDPPSPSTTSDSPMSMLDKPAEVRRRERAILALLRGEETPRAIASRSGLELDELFELADAYRTAGRKVLER